MGRYFLNRPSTKMFKYILTISLLVTGLQVGMIFLLEIFHPAGTWEVGNLDLNHQLAVGIWEVDHIMKNQVVVGNGLPVGMIFLQVIFLLEIVMEVGNLDLDPHPPAGIIWEVGNLDLDHQLADKKENEFLELGCLGLMAGFLFKDLNLCY